MTTTTTYPTRNVVDPRLAPVAQADRIQALDAMRGLGVLGILAVNAITFAMPIGVFQSPNLSPFPLEGASATGWWVMHVFFEAKFIALFSMLFGISVFLIGGERHDVARTVLLRRRLGWLALFGVLHGALFWFGDILLLYAICGFGMLWARSWSGLKLTIVGASVWLVLGFASYGLMAAMAFAPPEALDPMKDGMGVSAQAIQDALAAHRQLPFGSSWENFKSWGTYAPGAIIGYGISTVGLMMLGLGLFKLGVLSGRAPAWVYALLIAAGAVTLFFIAQTSSATLAAGFPFPHSLAEPANDIFAPVVALAYASVMILVLRFGAGLMLGPLKAVGRMAFTNYLTQTLIMTTIFYTGRGLGWFGLMDWPQLWMVVGCVWVAQLIWSPLWLSRFEMGPLEWVWRRLTYARPVPLRKVASA